MKYVLLNESGVVCVTLDKFPDGPFSEADRDRFLEAPDHICDGWRFAESTWYPPAAVSPEPFKKVSPVEFKMLFTSVERVAIRKARTTDPTVDDFFDLVEDPRLTYVDLALPSVQGALHYLAATQLITDARIAEILSGKVL